MCNINFFLWFFSFIWQIWINMYLIIQIIRPSLLFDQRRRTVLGSPKNLPHIIPNVFAWKIKNYSSSDCRLLRCIIWSSLSVLKQELKVSCTHFIWVVRSVQYSDREGGNNSIPIMLPPAPIVALNHIVFEPKAELLSTSKVISLRCNREESPENLDSTTSWDHFFRELQH